MKNFKFILNGFMALAFGLMFAQCAGNNNAAPTSAPAAGAAGSSNMKIAFVVSEERLLSLGEDAFLEPDCDA